MISGCIGPRGDGYQVGATMTVDEARAYHAVQARAFADAEADLVTAITMTYAEEAIGIAEAARAAGMPVVISFTVETDGRLPSGQPLGDAIEAVDAATGGYPAYYMVNCAHPTHFRHLLRRRARRGRRGSGGIRANASTLSHAELDEAESSTAATRSTWPSGTASCASSCRRSACSAAAAAPTTGTSTPSAGSRAEDRRWQARAASVERDGHDVPAGEGGGAAVGGGQHADAVLGDGDGVLEVRGAGAVPGDHGPAVGQLARSPAGRG